MEAHLPLDTRKAVRFLPIRCFIVCHQLVVESKEQPLQLRYDEIFVVPRVANNSAPRIVQVLLRTVVRVFVVGPTAWQISRIWIAGRARQFSAEDKSVVSMIEIRRVVGSLAVNVVEIETRRTEVNEAVGIV